MHRRLGLGGRPAADIRNLLVILLGAGGFHFPPVCESSCIINYMYIVNT